jgi:hypothetical protein
LHRLNLELEDSVPLNPEILSMSKLVLSATLVGGLFGWISMADAASSGPVFYGDAPDAHHPWAVHDGNRPQPKIITPGTFSSPEQPGKPPSDAIVLFDGTDLSHWEGDDGKPTKWIVHEGAMECVPKSGYIRTKESFGDCQLHVEWAAPTKVEGESQGRGNSGVFLMGLVEIQVLDNYNNPTYADGAAASVYGVNPPMANALRPPGQFQVYDIVFRRPIYKSGQAIDPGHVTVFQNGVLVQDHTMLEGPTGHMTRARPGPFPDKGPLKLQDHGNPVRYRNVWYRPLPPRPVEGGTDGYLTTEATMAKRKEIAAMLRGDASKFKSSGNNMGELLKLAESLEYDEEDATLQQVQTMAGDYVSGLKKLSGAELEAKKDEAKHLRDAFRFLARFKAIPADFAPKTELDQLVREHNWDKR